MSFAIDSLREQPVASSVWPRSWRRGFTLVELLVSIVIIAILAGLVFGALQRAGSTAKVVHTKSTIAKLNASLMDRWDSYRTRRLPFDPTFVLAKIKMNPSTNYLYVQQQIGLAPPAPPGGTMISRRAATLGGLPDPLAVPTTSAQFPTNAQVAAVRLLAMREMMKYEMPQGYGDFVDFSNPAGGGGWQMIPTQVLSAVPPITQTYLLQVNAAAQAGATQAQIQANDAAECLYMILTIGSTDNAFAGEQVPTQDVGDVDGDGLPEFQDAWVMALNDYIAKGNANSPISWIRWPSGYVSDFQPDQTSLGFFEYSNAHHDYFDPLKLDIPGGAPILPRGYQLTPLIFSAGPDGYYELHTWSGDLDPYDSHTTAVSPGQAGSWLDSNSNGREDYQDNVTNHDLDTRTGR